MNNIAKILKGSLVGIGAILPGVSGGVIAAAFNIYKDLVEALNNFIKHPIKAITSIWQFLVGIALGVIVGYFFVSFVFELFKLPVTFFFMGLIIGEIPQLFQEIKGIKIRPSHIITMIVSALLMVGVCFIDGGLTYEITGGVKYLIYFLIGVIMALSFIVPGLSGTMLLMAFGFYTLFTEFGNEILNGVFSNFLGVLVVLLGVAAGMLLFAKPLNFAIKKAPIHFNYAIIGIVIISPANIMLSLFKENQLEINDPSGGEIPPYIFDQEWYVWLICGVLFVIGLALALLFIKKKKEKNEEVKIASEEN
ncbi:DUF368 domain-containing protein [Acholeplasma sp. OttesenSCG-928-E16]|nr:DUF368 domain-containing protein [Acholeplasma sp. OttesenSCG-928-E16]